MSDEAPVAEVPDQSEQPELSALEARILGALMEKQRTTTDYYPMTLNALVQACNQKTSRNPIMSLTPGEVGHAVNLLRDRGLIGAGFSGRAERYSQLLCADAGPEPATLPPSQTAFTDPQRVDAMERQITQLRNELDALWRLTVLERDRPESG